MARRRPASNRRRADAGEYQPKGGVPFPTLGDGTPYAAGMPVRLDDPTGRTWAGTVQWVTWKEADRRWEAVVAWDERDSDPNPPPVRWPLTRLNA